MRDLIGFRDETNPTPGVPDPAYASCATRISCMQSKAGQEGVDRTSRTVDHLSTSLPRCSRYIELQGRSSSRSMGLCQCLERVRLRHCSDEDTRFLHDAVVAVRHNDQDMV